MGIWLAQNDEPPYLSGFFNSGVGGLANKINPRGDFMPGKFRAANRTDFGAKAFLIWISACHDIDGDGLPGQHMAFSENPTFDHAFDLKND